MRSASPGLRPTASLFYDPVLYVIGRLTGFRPYVGVSHEEVRDEVLRIANIDPDGDWARKDTSSEVRDGLYRRVQFAWRNQRREYCPPTRVAMCAKPKNGARGQWALTEMGVRRAKGLRLVNGRLVFTPTPNVSAEYLAHNFEELYNRITLHLRRSMRRSEMFDKVDDHAMNWITRVIQRDGLRKHVDLGQTVAPSRICAWARRGAYTDIRNEGREPVCRVFHGALTKRELADFDVSKWTTEHVPRTINRHENAASLRYAEHSEDDEPTGDLVDNLADDTNVEDQVVGSDAFEHALDRVSKLVLAEIEEEDDPEWHQRLIHDRFVREMTLREIAEEHGLSYEHDRNRITLALSRVRDIMLRARDEGELDDLISR